jgi:hypothetical protein
VGYGPLRLEKSEECGKTLAHALEARKWPEGHDLQYTLVTNSVTDEPFTTSQTLRIVGLLGTKGDDARYLGGGMRASFQLLFCVTARQQAQVFGHEYSAYQIEVVTDAKLTRTLVAPCDSDRVLVLLLRLSHVLALLITDSSIRDDVESP